MPAREATSLDVRIRRELDKANSASGELRDDIGALLRMESRENGALRAVLDECRILDVAADTEPIAHRLRNIIAKALQIGGPIGLELDR